MTMPEAPVLVSRDGPITRVLLNRPRALNALTMDMFVAVADAVDAAASDGSTAVLLQGAGERGFSGGGDVKYLANCGVEAGVAVLRREYELDHAISVSPVPVIAVMDGVTMGGGIGLSGHAAVRIVTERSMLAMPEVRIGITPDVGGHHLLARAPGRLGDLLAITAGAMSAGDAIALGFADHYVHSSRIARLVELLVSGVDHVTAVAEVSEPAPVSELLATAEWFAPIADAVLADDAAVFADPVSAASELLAALEGADRAEARETAASVRSMNPASVAITLAQLARTRSEALSLEAVLRDDLRVLGRTFGLPNFTEGVRAQMIDKDGDPRWSPARVEELDRAEIAAILDPRFLADEEPLQVASPEA